MKRAVLCVPDPENYIDQLDDYSIMIVNPKNTPARLGYLLDRADWSLLITNQGEQHRAGSNYENERVLWYTSGTTGDSKFCSFSQAQLDRASDNIIQEYALDVNDRYVSVMGLWHAHGQGMFWATRRAGCETHFLDPTNLRPMSGHSPTFISAIPDILKTISRFEFDHLRFIRSASAAMPDNLYQQLKSKFDIPVVEAFGMTEALSHCFTNPLHGEQRMGTVGLPDDVEADIVNGELHICGSTVFTSGWYNTGDLAEQDDAGYYRIIGRSKDRISVRGYKLDPISVERQLAEQISNLGECVIFGAEKVNCIYTGDVDPGLVTRTLIQIHPACNPAFVQRHDAIPMGDSGKISRSWLKTKFQVR
jgi:acyl-CoA synthetase (AMP-forming)/AMP-acid ligase II